MTISDVDLIHLQEAVQLAEEALASGDQPFGSILVDGQGQVLARDHNRISGGDHTQHPEFALARWAAQNMTPAQRKDATVYTSGEHCPMCAAAHGWVGLGRIVYAASSAQLTVWLQEFGVAPGPLHPLPIQEVIRDADVTGPVAELTEQVRQLHQKYYLGSASSPH